MQWLDEPSFMLLHFAVRHLASSGVAFVVAARPAELEENRASGPVVQALRRDDALTELFLGPLAPATIAELTEPIAPGADTAGDRPSHARQPAVRARDGTRPGTW